MNRGLIVIIAVLALGVALIGYRMGATGGETALAPVDMEGLDDPTTLISLATPITLGDPDAPITIIEFGDYQCPACRDFNARVKPQIDLTYVQSGQAKFVYYDYPIIGGHPHAFLAARAARCAGDQDQYWAYHDKLFVNQQYWSPEMNPPLDLFEAYAETLGLNSSDFSSCLRSDRHAETVTANLALGIEMGVTGTPTVMISEDGSGSARRPMSNGFDEIQGMMDDLLGASGAAGSDASNEGGE